MWNPGGEENKRQGHKKYFRRLMLRIFKMSENKQKKPPTYPRSSEKLLGKCRLKKIAKYIIIKLKKTKDKGNLWNNSEKIKT